MDQQMIAENIRLVSQNVTTVLRAMPSVLMRADLSDEEAVRYAGVYPEWEPDWEYKQYWILRYEGELYRVQKDLTSSKLYPPNGEGLESLYWHITIDPETGYEEWVQPINAETAYSNGDIVKHNGKFWISTVDGVHTNVWEPGVYGWEEYVL